MARLLLVDDEKMARTLYGDYLRGVGHEVTAVATIAEVKEALAFGRYDVVVTDLILPKGDGMEVLQHTKEHYPGIEVVVITGLDKVDPAVRAIKSGAAEYLVKPVAPEVLQHAVNRALATRELLQENAALRRYVSLLETGQRISTTLDRSRLAETACAAFLAMASASAVMLFQADGSGRSRLLGSQELAGSAQEAALIAYLAPRLGGSREARVLEGLPGACPRALVVPAMDGEDLLGYALLLYPGSPPEGIAEATSFLARCLALALRNLGRIAEVEDLAYLDDLTHLFNTRYLHLVLDREVKSAQQTHGVFSLLFLDLDYFKSVNDTHGHLVGSQLLVETARVLKGCVRDRDVAIRYGGDEYVVLLRGTDSGGALKVAERIRRTVENHRFLAREGHSLALSTCIGVASFPEHAQDKATLLDLADRAMYRGKKGTRNVVYVAAKDLEATPPGRHSQPTGS
ncbi:diguanylate cyclase [Vitiosangium sp. GDMCC 1.1324]|uniref:GGDEF domain-containing response regulator n=1 Tax=Vitiosangium sp. (strain GDMCC 1.1324) TaxID=2138576 RepID=UPI000D34F20D|nr:diguanylate cyclase [Vitiosangium sp. GDMCC 1.1324]PTL85226.1 diguanylate cyclase response regulator [Vitiosangium sp. GDMCC 1.1324]